MLLGIDGALSFTGWCVYDNKTMDVVDAGKIVTCYAPIKKLEEDDKIVYIANALLAICLKYAISEAVMEGQFVSAVQSKMTSMQLSRVRGAIMYALKMNGIKIHYIQPPEVKKLVTGKGNADKLLVADDIILMYKDNEIIKNIGPFNDKHCKDKTSDIYDSIAIAMAYCKKRGSD